MDRDAWDLAGVAALAEIEERLDALSAQLQEAPDWRPGAALLAQAQWLRERLQQLGAAWDTRLVVAIVGPSGAGKSTLLNALAGANLAETGLTRPTTRTVTAFTGDAQAARALRQVLDQDVAVETSGRAQALEYLTLLDTPDTNTTPENQAALRSVLEAADIILAVFPAQNPRLHDNLAFLRPYVQRLPQESVIPILNMIDRVPPGELGEVTADFRRALGTEWGLQPERIYRISAKRSSLDAHFADDEEPLNTLNEFPELERLIFETLNRGVQRVDRRLSRAQRLLALYQEQVRRAAEASAQQRERAEDALALLGQQIAEMAQNVTPGPLTGVGALDLAAALYGLLSSRWWGPVGWLVGLWALALRAVSFVARLGRRAPFAPGPHSDALQEPAPLGEPSGAELAQMLGAAWPPVGDALVAAGFASRARDSAVWKRSLDTALEQLAGQWGAYAAARLEQVAERLSAWALQILLNLPVLGMLGWIGVEAVLAFVQRRYLPATYYQNGAIALVAVWVLAYLLLQGAASIALRRLRRGGLGRELAHALAETILAPWADQLRAIRHLQERP
jgi:energy-coupling factor transporter ATP-binding protein EcfA2